MLYGIFYIQCNFSAAESGPCILVVEYFNSEFYFLSTHVLIEKHTREKESSAH
jgi:hypothetical protein